MFAHRPIGIPTRWIAAAFAVALVACAGGPSEDLRLEQTQQRINGGDPHPGDPAVMLIYHQSGSMCTGTLIGTRVILTAKHCVARDNGTLLATWGYSIGVGPSMWTITHEYGVSDVRTTPGTDIENSDVALLILDQDAIEQPYRYVLEMPFDLTGLETFLVGYGVDQCPGDQSGTKLSTTDSIIGWYSQNDFFTQGRGANQGDSGGPAFDPDTMEVMGVISRGSYDVCDGYTIVAAVAPWKTLINEALTDTGDCAPTMNVDLCGDSIDNNCDGVVDDGCSPTGTACTEDSDCASRFCRDMGAGLICTDPCEPGGQDTCLVGSFCMFLSCGEGGCAPGEAGTKRVGEACQSHTECENLLCRDPGTGSAICMAPCDPSLGQCLATEACLPFDVSATCGGCVPDDLHAGPWRLGERCVGDTDCVNGRCIDDGGLAYCTQACDEEQLPCPSGFHCRDNNCVRGHKGLLANPCFTDEDCDATFSCYGGDVLNQLPGYCTSICTGGQACPTGSTCEGNACVPSGLPLGQVCEASEGCFSQGCFPFAEKNSCTAVCDRREPCPPVMACVVSDNGMTLCQPNGDPLVEGPTEPPVQPNPKPKCSTGTSGGLGLPILLMLLFVLLRRRRG